MSSTKDLFLWTQGYYAEITTAANNLGTRLLCVLRFKKVWETIQICFTSKGCKGFGPAYLLILYVENLLEGGEFMLSLLQDQCKGYEVRYDKSDLMESCLVKFYDCKTLIQTFLR